MYISFFFNIYIFMVCFICIFVFVKLYDLIKSFEWVFGVFGLFNKNFLYMVGIGYFILFYLVYVRVDCFYVCEWNLDVVEVLRKNFCLNGVEDRCVVYFGDNR